MSVVEALAREVGSVGVLLHKMHDADWQRPTRCAPMTVADLVAHLARQAARVEELLALEPIDAEPEKDAATYYSYDPASIGADVLARAQQAAKDIGGPKKLVAAWDERWVHALQAARAALPDDPVLPSPLGTIRLSEYLKTRVVEATVHHMDIDDALGKLPHPDHEALEITADVLRIRLGTDLRRFGMDDVRFVLTGTGRAPLSDEEMSYLGPLSERFPLLA